jgi:hypothetical protein
VRISIGGFITVMLVLSLVACRSVPTDTKVQQCFVPAFEVTGDVEQPLNINSLEEFLDSGLERDKNDGKVVSLIDIVTKAVPTAESYSVLIIGDDGLTAEVDGSSISDCNITFSADNAWEAINPKHPVSSNIKRIKEIVVASNQGNTNSGLSIIEQAGNIKSITPGGMYKTVVLEYPVFEGKSTVEHDGKQNWTGIYTRRKMVDISSLGIPTEVESLMAVARDGSQSLIKKDGLLELNGNYIDYVFPNLKDRVRDMVGIIIDPPGASNMDAYHDAAHFLDKGDDVLIIVLDGFGYHQYQHAVKEGYARFLGSLAPAKAAFSVYTPVTNAGLAAILTGKSPSENGVHTRKEMDILTPSIFGYASQKGKNSVMVEGNIKILNLEVEPILNIDKNSNGSTDDEIRDKAIEKMNGDCNLMVVHFHGIDDSGHSHGDISPETMERIKTTDGYVNELVSRWSGKVIITADHGMHSTSDGGGHGEFRYEDMIVPYIICDGKGEK